MSKSTPTRVLGRGGRDVTVLAATIEYNYRRRAKNAFWLVTVIVYLLTVAIAVGSMHAITATVLASVVGMSCGAVAWTVVRVWPIARIIWWWLPETILAYLAYKGFTALAAVPYLPIRIAILVIAIGVPTAIGPTRRAVIGVFFCLYTRHRLRVLFTDVIKSNQHGSLPLILWARPTPIGERVWIFLRPGLSKTDLQARLERMAVACHCMSVMVEQPGGNAAFVRLDIKRREVLTRTITSPLPALIHPSTPTTPPKILHHPEHQLLVPPGLNLDEVPLVKYIPSSAVRAGKRPAANAADASPSADASATNPKPVHLDEDWI